MAYSHTMYTYPCIWMHCLPAQLYLTRGGRKRWQNVQVIGPVVRSAGRTDAPRRVRAGVWMGRHLCAVRVRKMVMSGTEVASAVRRVVQYMRRRTAGKRSGTTDSAYRLGGAPDALDTYIGNLYLAQKLVLRPSLPCTTLASSGTRRHDLTSDRVPALGCLVHRTQALARIPGSACERVCVVCKVCTWRGWKICGGLMALQRCDYARLFLRS